MKKSICLLYIGLFLLVILLSPLAFAKINYIVPQRGSDEIIKNWITFEDATQYVPENSVPPVYTVTNDKIKKIPTAVRFVGKEAFSAHAKILNFEDLPRATEVTNQYYDGYDVMFQPEKNQHITILNTDIQDEFYLKYPAHSGKSALAALPAWPFTSKFVPLVMLFKTPKKLVGFYIGNGNEYGQDNVAYIRAYDAQGKQIGVTLFRERFPNAIQTFIGIESRGVGISRLSLDYGKTNFPELIDDLITEDFTPETIPRADLYIKSVRYASNAIVAVVCNGGDVITSNFLVQFSVYDVSSLSFFKGNVNPTQCVEVSSKPYTQTFQFVHEVYPVYVNVDPKDYIIETKEDNNDFIRKEAKELAPVLPSKQLTQIKKVSSTDDSQQKPAAVQQVNPSIQVHDKQIPVDAIIDQPLPSANRQLYAFCTQNEECESHECVKQQCVEEGILIRLFRRWFK